MLSKSLDQSVVQPSARSGETGDASASKRPPSATAQSILEKERAHNSRPHSAKSVNENVLLVREKHTIGREIAKKEGTSRPQSREGLGASSRGPGGPSSRPPSQNDDARPPSQSRLTGASGTRDLVGGGADTAASAKSGTKSDPTGSAPSAPAKTGTSRDLTAASPLAKSGTKRDLIQVSTAGSAPMARSGTKKDLAAGASERRGGRGKRGSAAAEALSPAGAGGGGVDNAVVEAMQAELDAYKAAEARLKERLKEKDAQIHELTHKVFYLNDELNGATDKQGKMQAEVERARESNARFDDVKQLLQLAENERVKLMDEVEKLQEGVCECVSLCACVRMQGKGYNQVRAMQWRTKVCAALPVSSPCTLSQFTSANCCLHRAALARWRGMEGNQSSFFKRAAALSVWLSPQDTPTA